MTATLETRQGLVEIEPTLSKRFPYPSIAITYVSRDSIERDLLVRADVSPIEQAARGPM